MRINFKNKVYKTNDFLVEMYVGLLVTGKKTIEQVPNYGNLRAVVQVEVDRINREWEERKKLRKKEKDTLNSVFFLRGSQWKTLYGNLYCNFLQLLSYL